MSLASEAGDRLRRVPRWVVVLVIVVLSLLAIGAFRSSLGDAVEAVALVRGDLVLSVDVEGELEAVRSREIGAPPVAEVEFKIAFLAPEGAEVGEQDPVLRFDTEALERLLAQKRAEYEEAKTKVEQKTIDLEMKRLAISRSRSPMRTAGAGQGPAQGGGPDRRSSNAFEYEKATSRGAEDASATSRTSKPRSGRPRPSTGAELKIPRGPARPGPGAGGCARDGTSRG